jgi:transposase
MRPRFKELTSSQIILFPARIDEKIPQDHPVRLVNEIVDNLNIDDIIEGYKGGGTTSFHPRMLIKVLFFGYFNNVYSCRRIAELLEQNIYFMWLSGNSTPDFRTINNFRGKRLQGKIQKLFADIVKMMAELGYVSLDKQFVDGTIMESAANRYTFVWKKSIEKNKAKLEEKINKVISEIEQSIKSDKIELTKPVEEKKINRDLLKEKLDELNLQRSELNKEQHKALNKIEKEQLPKLDQYENQLEILGERNSYSKTDPDATFMRTKEDILKNGELRPAYNLQISTENQIITNFSLHQNAGDTTTLIDHQEQFNSLYGKYSKKVIADAGFGSEQNYEYLDSIKSEAFVKYNYFDQEQKKGFKDKLFHIENLFYNEEQDFYVCPIGQRMYPFKTGSRLSIQGYESELVYYKARNCTGCPMKSMCFNAEEPDRIITVSPKLRKLKKAARIRLLSEEGIALRKQRCIEPEPVFGHLKYNNKYKRFRMYGLIKIEIDLGLAAIGHNLRKWAKKLENAPINPLNELFSHFICTLNNIKPQIKILNLNCHC